jgi:hypothetical protein
MSIRVKYLIKANTLMLIAFGAILPLALNAFGVDVPLPTADELGRWPAATLLGAVSISSMWFAYRTWTNSMKAQIETAKALTLLSQRPCMKDIREADYRRIKTKQWSG